MPTIFRALVQRRSPRRNPAYVPWLLIYVMTGLMFWHGKGDRSPDEIVSLWPGLIPLCIVGIQCLRPTILGWAVVLLFALLYDGFVLYIEFLAYSVRDPGTGGLREVVLASFFFVLFIVVPVALVVAAWPKALSSSPPPNNALQRTEAGGGVISEFDA